MKRRTPLKRSTKPSRRWVKPKAQASAKNGAEPDYAFRGWIARWPCLVDPHHGWSLNCWYPESGTDPAHIVKWRQCGIDHGNIVPLCRRHHMEQETIGNEEFQRRHGVELKAKAMEYEARYQAERAEAR